MSSTSMKFVTPSQYTKSNLAHFIINTRAVNDFIKVHPSLAVKDNVLDFGCGTGETTAAIAQGKLGDLGNPGKVRRYLILNILMIKCCWLSGDGCWYIRGHDHSQLLHPHTLQPLIPAAGCEPGRLLHLLQQVHLLPGHLLLLPPLGSWCSCGCQPVQQCAVTGGKVLVCGKHHN